MTTNLEPVFIENVLSEIKGQGEDALALVRRAYNVALKAHEGQLRKSGEPYIQHSLTVALLLAELHLEAEAIAAALLHDVVEDSDFLVDDMEERFGPTIAEMVDGVTKLDEIKRIGRKAEEDRDEQELESLRKMFLATAKNPRVLLIKLADRLHNMRTLDALTPEKRQRMAEETMQIFAPLANRLGIWRWKSELEDLAFKYLEKDLYKEIANQISAKQEEREKEIERHIGRLRHHLWLEGIKADIRGRPKHIYSIYRKRRRKQVSLERIYDSRAIRVIVDRIPDCYHVVGVVHSLWSPIPGEFDDYIATPKENGYQSLHTAVVGMDGKTLEIQIRTQYMHEVAEYGIASHWRYKEGGKRDPQFEEQVAALREEIEVRKEDDARRFVTGVSGDFFQDRVYVFTPKGQVLDLPNGATPIDFAYYIHTEIGHRCRGAKVNGNWVPLDYELNTGDQVEIMTSKKAGPSRDWLNPTLGYVRTSRARSKIRQWFRRQDREQNITMGWSMLEREMKRLGVADMPHEAVAALMGYDEPDDFLAAIGFGDIHTAQIASRVLEAKRKEEEDEAEEIPLSPLPDTSAPTVKVMGTGGLLTRLAKCCNPIPDQPIIGYVTRGKGITVHRRECPNALNVSDPERLIEVSWGREQRTFPVQVSVRAFNRTGLLHDISGILTREHVNIVTVGVGKKNENPITLHFTLEITDINQLTRILAKISNVTNVIGARREA
jgi:GTP pyrophosphokinase